MPVPLDNLLPATAPQPAPLTTTQLAVRAGMTKAFIRMEIRLGELKAVRFGRGRRCVYRIPVTEAERYLERLGLS